MAAPYKVSGAMNVTLSDGTTGVIPDGLSDDAIGNQFQRLEAAKTAAAKPRRRRFAIAAIGVVACGTKSSRGGSTVPQAARRLASRSRRQRKRGSTHPPRAERASNAVVERHRATRRVSDTPAAPERDWPMRPTSQHRAAGPISPPMSPPTSPRCPGTLPPAFQCDLAHGPELRLRRARAEHADPRPGSRGDRLGTTRRPSPWLSRAENGGDRSPATGARQSDVRASSSGIFGEPPRTSAGSYAGGKIADATDPRLRRGRTRDGSRRRRRSCNSRAGREKEFASTESMLMARGQSGRPPRALRTHATPGGARRAGGRPDAARQSPPVNSAAASSRRSRTWLGKIPFTGAPIQSAQAERPVADRAGDPESAANIAGLRPVSTAANAPGDALLTGVREHVDNALNTAKPQIDDIEKQLGTLNTQGPGGGSAMVDPRGLINELNGMKTATDAAGNVRNAVDSGTASQIDAEIAKINSVRQPENPALGRATAKQDRRIAELPRPVGRRSRRPGAGRGAIAECAGGAGRQHESVVRDFAPDEIASGRQRVRLRGRRRSTTPPMAGLTALTATPSRGSPISRSANRRELRQGDERLRRRDGPARRSRRLFREPTNRASQATVTMDGV